MIIKKANTFDILKNVYLFRSEPISVVHFLTNRCNARCSFCFIDFENPQTFKNELELKEIDQLTKSFGNSLLNVNFTGGEPFARKDFKEIAKLYVKNTNIQSIYITTNGSLPDRIIEFAESINEFDNNIELTFQISIDDFPEKHNKVRKIKNLFDNCHEVFHKLKKIDNNINPVICITVTQENCDNIKEIYKVFLEKYHFNSIKCIAVRDEGVYKTPENLRKKIFESYSWLSKKIEQDVKDGILKNYNPKTLQGRLHRKKDIIANDMVRKMYLEPKFISPCHAGSLFGVITASGDVYPCEILEDKIIGNLRDYNMNFSDLWKSKKREEIKKFILKSNCNCTYECALSYNVLSNWRYQPSLISSAVNLTSKY